MPVSFKVAPEPEDADIVLDDFDALEDIREAIQSELEAPTCRISLHTTSTSSLTPASGALYARARAMR